MADIKIARPISACEVLIGEIYRLNHVPHGAPMEIHITLLLNAIAELAGRVQILEENEILRTPF